LPNGINFSRDMEAITLRTNLHGMAAGVKEICGVLALAAEGDIARVVDGVVLSIYCWMGHGNEKEEQVPP
jgi:hypothetical protein